MSKIVLLLAAVILVGNGLGIGTGGSVQAQQRLSVDELLQELDRNSRPRRDGSQGQGDAIVLEKRVIYDPGMNNMPSHTFLMPRGWQFRGGVVWTPNKAVNFVNFVGTVTASNHTALNFLPGQAFTYTDNPQILAQMGAHMGQELHDGKILLPPPRQPGEAIMRFVMPRLRPQAHQVRLLRVVPIPEALQHLAQLMKPMLDANRQNNQMAQMVGGGMRSDSWYQAERIRVAYIEAEKPWEEEFTVWYFGTQHWISGMDVTRDTILGDWYLSSLRAARARVGQLDRYLPLLTTVSLSVRETPQWFNAITDLRNRILKIQLKGARERARIMRESAQRISRTMKEISDMQMKSWRENQARIDRTNRAFTNYIRGVDDYQMPDGDTVSLDNTYSNVFANKSGGFILTDNALYNPNTDPNVNAQSWQRIEPVRPR